MNRLEEKGQGPIQSKCLCAAIKIFYEIFNWFFSDDVSNILLKQNSKKKRSWKQS